MDYKTDVKERSTVTPLAGRVLTTFTENEEYMSRTYSVFVSKHHSYFRESFCVREMRSHISIADVPRLREETSHLFLGISTVP